MPGYLGLGPNSGSRIHASLNNQPQGDTVLDSIFRQNISAPNILTILLGRSEDPAEIYPGNITVGEVLQGFENITSQPQVPVTIVTAPDAEAQHWQVLLDEDGIIGPDGQPILIQTGVQSTPNQNQLTAVFDTGFSFPQVPLCVKHMSTSPSVFAPVVVVVVVHFIYNPIRLFKKGGVQRDIFWCSRCIATIRGWSWPDMAYTLRC